MEIKRIIIPSFSVIGKEGSTADGPGFVQRLWVQANAHFDEVAHLAKRDENGVPLGFWGAMTDRSRTFRPWEDGFSRGLYLAGVECEDDAAAPPGWTKWTVPGFEYLRAECTSPDLFSDMLEYLREQKLELVGAIQDFTDPKTGKNYMLFPIAVNNECSAVE